MFPTAASLEQEETKEPAEDFDLVKIADCNSVSEKPYPVATS
jgi:hypothetical protein